MWARSSILLGFLSIFSVLPTSVFAGILTTDAVSYCTADSAVDVQHLDITYHQSNRSVTFSFSIQAIESDLNVDAYLYLSAYGRDIVNLTIPLCSIFDGIICPLPTVNFTGYGTYPIPEQYTKDIPALAYSVPDLEAYAQLQLIRTDNNQVAACLQATLSNGKSTRQIGVAIGTGVFTLVALLVGLWHTGMVYSPSPAQYRWFDILYLFQTAAASGLLSVEYPTVYTSFSRNFAWAFALFYSSDMQNSIDQMRSDTGGTVEAAPDNQIVNNLVTSNLYSRNLVDFNSFTSPLALRAYIEERAAVVQSYFDDNSGLAHYVEAMHFREKNVLDTIFFFYLAFIGIAIVFHIIVFIVVLICAKAGADWAKRLRQMWWGFCGGNALRLCLIGFLPLWIFGFLQFRLGGSGLSIFFAAFGIAITFLPLLAVFILSILRSSRTYSTSPNISRLYTSYRWFHSVGVLYRPYRQKFHYFWFAPLILAMIARAGFIAFGRDQPWAQVIGNVVIEFILLLLLVITRPHKDLKGDFLIFFLCFCRMCAFGLMIAFIPSVAVGGIVKTIIGFVIIVLFGVPTILLLLGLFWNLGYGYWWRRNKRRIEDGLEVDRFVDSQDDQQDHPEMRQSVDANTFVSGAGTYGARQSVEPSRRTSVIEPIADRDSRAAPTHYGSPTGSVPSSPVGPNSPTNQLNDPYWRTSGPPMASAAAYDRAASGGGHYGDRYPTDRPLSSGSNRTNYYTPMSPPTSPIHRNVDEIPRASWRNSGQGTGYFARDG
ncbi:hypothetical protein BD324DRAFT_606460 [Kockovaella imperatae]|uniref:ML-like domain-containing protein n=1 Tax=Kockovaella imperatae TaxID=4999 RepID=A0A1Y1UT21_9TREE|nr:hypothetical protein BD324DRAFT_606460 [Kockovaella imperatae]ORX40576.1 hypothetical protein BD324DRAFT_606460 [Kockovaella imperatae]